MQEWMRHLRRALSRPPVLRNLTTMTLDYVWGHRFHATDAHELVHVLHGQARIEFEQQSFDVGPQDTFIIPRGTNHRDVRVEGSGYRVLYVFFRWPGADELMRGIDPAALCAMPAKVKSQAHMQMRAMEEEYLGEVPGARLRMRLILFETLLALIRQSPLLLPNSKPDAAGIGGDGDAKRKLARARRVRLAADARQYLEEHFDQPIGLDELAARLGVSPFHLCRTFTREFGTSMTDMLTLIRVERAKEMLDRGELSIKEVAGRSGFSDANYFAKVFRKVSGCSPSEYRLSREKRS